MSKKEKKAAARAAARAEGMALADPKARLLLGRLWHDYLRQHLKWLAVAVVFMMMEGSVLGGLSYLVAPMFDQVLIAKDREMMFWIGAMVFGLFSLRAVAGFIQRLIIVRIGLRVVNDMQKDLLAHLLSLDTAFFQHHSPGALIERVRGDAQTLQGIAANALMSVGRDAVSLIALVGVALYYDWKLTIIAFVGLPLLLIPMSKTQKWIRSYSRVAREASATISNRLDEVFHGIHAIKVNRLEDHERDRFSGEVDGFLDQRMKAEIGQSALPALVDILAAAGFLAVLVYGGSAIIDGDKSPGEFLSFFTAVGLVFDPLRRLSSVAGRLQSALASLERLYGLFDERPTIVDPPKSAAVPRRDTTIEMRDVHFRYDEDAPILRGLSITARAGQTTALVGHSGAGKSTVFHLLNRLIEPQSGEITIGGTAIDAVPLADLRALYSVVSQEAALFDETIRYNFRLGRLDATDAEIEEAAERAFVTDFAKDQPEGLDTRVGPRGGSLSGGQRQRIVIGRAMLRDAPILLLDEPTSALDASAEATIQKALSRLSAGRTTLVIAHRLATIRDADRIIVMDKGTVADEGTHDELLARGGLYKSLYDLQFRSEGTS
jgi:ABC-type multidrug transport system fused ATPase/permease subunit